MTHREVIAAELFEPERLSLAASSVPPPERSAEQDDALHTAIWLFQFVVLPKFRLTRPEDGAIKLNHTVLLAAVHQVVCPVQLPTCGLGSPVSRVALTFVYGPFAPTTNGSASHTLLLTGNAEAQMVKVPGLAE